MRFSGCSLRWLLPILLILSTATQMVAQGNPCSPVDITELVRQATSGDPQAQFKLGVMYADGTVNCNPKNDAEAVRWFRKAAVQGLAVAQERLGTMYQSGEGISQDDVEACFWLNLAASTVESAKEKSDKASVNLPPQSPSEAQERCRKWAETHPPLPRPDASASIAPEFFLDQLTTSLKCKFGTPIIALILLAAFLLAIVPTGCAAWLGGNKVFFRRDIRDTCLKGRLKKNVKKVLSKQEAYQQEINDIDKKLSNPTMSSFIDLRTISALIKLRELREGDLKKAEREVQLVPFFLSDLMFAWCASYPPLAILIWFAPSAHGSGSDSKATWAALSVAGAGILYISLIWCRNWLGGKSDEERRIYSFGNRDISPLCYRVAVGCEFIIFVALSRIWYRWISFYDVLNCGSLCAAHVLHDWQVSSAFLAAGFLVFAWVYWDIVVVAGDQRYLVQAVLVQVVWGATWLVISLPLIGVWGQLGGQGKPKLVSALAGVGSFFLPFLKAALTPKEE
ncbi:MAG: tetratricopeptide repeat protein [Candidatus Sulfotelmatobacter sp.]